MYDSKKVQILLSSHNGGKYIRDQLNSFLKLDNYQDIKVLIRDDGSADDTAAILREYEKEYGFKVIYGENIGIIASYNVLFKNADMTCDYYALCDQDDVWLPHKVSRGIQLLSRFSDNDKPLLYGSRVEIVDSKLNHLGYSPLYEKGAAFYNALVQNILPGHTMILNRALLKLISEIPDRPEIYADWWIYLIASGIGSAVYDEKVGVLHRQHESNTIGHEQSFLKNSFKRIKRLLNGNGNSNSMQLKAFYNIYYDYLPVDYREEIDKYLGCMDSIKKRIGYALTCKAYRHTMLENLIFKCLYILGKYKC